MIFFVNFGKGLKFTKMIIHHYDFISHSPEKNNNFLLLSVQFEPKRSYNGARI